MTFEPEAVAEFLARLAKKGIANEGLGNGSDGSDRAVGDSGRFELLAQLACDAAVERLPSPSGTRCE